MTNETRKRIEAYNKLLPEMKERVMAVTILLVMSISMMISASFAWLTISRHPEVAGVSTSVAANGNLEIALATGNVNTAKAPEESKVGDSSAAKGQSIEGANITWGNLVNLSDPSYGLDNLTLRPAQLNQSALLTSPLYGAVYQGDGRVEKLNSSFAYSIWDGDKEVFIVSDDIGVRAISSTTVEVVQGAEEVLEIYRRRGEVETANLLAGSAYSEITNNKEWMDSLAVIMGTFMTAKMNAGQGDAKLTNPTMEQEDVKNLTAIFGAFVDVYDLQFDAMTKLVNYQLYLKYGTGDNKTPYTEKTVDNIKAATEATLKTEGLQLSGLNQAKSDYPKLVDGYEKLQELSAQGNVKWEDSGLNTIVNSLMNVGTCTLDGTPINNIGVSNATGYLDGKTHNAIITNGVLYNFEKLNGARCDVRGLTVSAKVKRAGITIPASISANIATNAPIPAQFSVDLEYTDSMKPTGALTEIAQDTYGLAVDLWVRTNAPGSYLTLEGNVLTKSETVRATGKDSSGNTVELYTLTRSDEEAANGGTYTLDLYKVVTKDENDEEVTIWYNAVSHATVTLEEGETPTAKMDEIITVIGFEGENRVWEDANAWEDNSQLSLDATTQGSGSCYVYYADSPEDQARSLKLLEAMNVAFVDDTGKLMATAIMDTERFYAENGRVTVPLALKSDSLNIGTDSEGNDIYAITPLVKNEPKRIMAIVYLDGTKLTNQDVLAASDIQGKLNIQFGSSVNLNHAEDEALLNATRSVSATIDNSNFKYDESIESGTPMKTNVTLAIDGDEPTEVTAFFIRAISSTQGSREKVMTFKPQEDGSWKADYTFTAPGNYVLRSVELDGQTYDLETCPTVTVEGFTIKSLDCTQAVNRHISIMTAASSSTVDLKLQFASDKVEAMPATVQGRFLREGDGTAVNINFTYNSGGVNKGFWTGQAAFISSGEYTLEYLVLDGEYAHLEDGLIQTATVYLGMKTAVYTDSPISFKFVPSEMTDNQKNLYMKVKIMDNTGKVMEGLQDARLYYQMEGSSLLENGFNAPLEWDAGTGYYTGTFYDSKVGVFKFSHVTVGSNTITYAEDSPVFRVISPEPPSYVGFTENTYVYSANGDIKMNARLRYSSTATVAALIRNLGDGKEYEVQGTKASDADNVQEWSFLIPTTADGKQDGNWQLETIEVWNYYDADGNYIEAEIDENGLLVEGGERDEPLVFTVDGQITKAVNTLTVTVNLPENYDAHLGNSATTGSEVTIATATASFLTTQTVTVPTVTIVDFEGKPVGTTDENGKFNSLVSGVKFTYDYGGQSQVYGGYTSTAVVATDDVLTINMTSTDGKTFSQSDTASRQYAGVYTPELLYTVNGKTYTKTAAEMGTTAPTFAVWSKKPTVTITAITPTGTYSVDNSPEEKIEDTYKQASASWGRKTTTWTLNPVHKKATSSISEDALTATIYFKCFHEDDSTWSSTGYGVSGHRYHAQSDGQANTGNPSVTINLAGISGFTTAKLNFSDEGRIYEKMTTTTVETIYRETVSTELLPYSWSAVGNQTRYIGYSRNVEGRLSDAVSEAGQKIIAGTITANTLTVVHSGITYTFTIPTITINNPY